MGTKFTVVHTRQYYAALFPDRTCGHLMPPYIFGSTNILWIEY